MGELGGRHGGEVYDSPRAAAPGTPGTEKEKGRQPPIWLIERAGRTNSTWPMR